LTKLRIHERLFQRDLSEEISIHQSTIANWERGFRGPPFDTLIKIADYFEVMTCYILGVKDRPLSVA